MALGSISRLVGVDPFPARNWLRKVTRTSLRADALAGFTNAAIVLPQGVAFATIAGLPPEYGLYTAMVTAVIAALFGSSMVMISGPTTAISAVLFASISNLAEPGTSRFIELALLATIIVGVMQIIAGLVRLGALISFVSHSVMTAFTAAAAILIAASQLAGATGIDAKQGGNALERITRVIESSSEINSIAVIICAVTLASAIILQRVAPKFPGLLVSLVLGSAVAVLLDAANNGVAMVAALPSALPAFAPPPVSAYDISMLTSAAAAIALIGLLEAISIGRAFAVRRKERFDANQEMIGQGLSNVVGGFFQCYAGSGSFTRSGVNAEAGAVTPLSSIFASAFLLGILLLVAHLVTYVPVPALAGVILYVAWRLVHFRELRHVVTTSRSETVILVLTLLAGLLIELNFAIYVGVIASFAVFIYKSSQPTIVVSTPMVAELGRRKFRDADQHKLPECPQVVTMRLDGPLFFGSVEHVERELRRVDLKRPAQRLKIFYLKGIGKLDLAGADLLIDEIRRSRERGGCLHLVAIFPTLLQDLRRFHVIDELGEGRLHISKGDAISAALKQVDPKICATCTKRVFLECAELPCNQPDTSASDQPAAAAPVKEAPAPAK